MKQLLRSYHLLYILLYPLVHLLYPIRVRHSERLPDGPMVLCAPHSSMLDPIFLMMAMTIKRFPRFMAKKELRSVPFVGWVLKRIGVIFVDRGIADIASIRAALGVLKSGGIVGIFPEGTRVQEDHASAAKSGAIMLASRTGAALQPVWMPRKKRIFRPVEIVFGEPYTLPRLSGGSEAYHVYAEDLMRRIGLLGKEKAGCT